MVSTKMIGLLSHVPRPVVVLSLRLHPAKNLQKPCEHIQAAWDGLSQWTIRNIYNSMLKCLDVVLANMAALLLYVLLSKYCPYQS